MRKKFLISVLFGAGTLGNFAQKKDCQSEASVYVLSLYTTDAAGD